MNRRVNWKKGMRLTDDIFKMSDQYHAEMVKKAFMLAAYGRFGLLPSACPFHLVMDIKADNIEVTELRCLAVTKDGSLIDVDFDSRYSGSYDTRADFSTRDETKAYWLLLSTTDGWTGDGEDSCTPVYAFHMVEEFSHVPDNSLPLARIVFDMGWREDDVYFIPPCLTLNAHPQYVDMVHRFQAQLSRLDIWIPQRLQTETGEARRILWPIIRELVISLDKESDTFSPATLLSKIQQCVSGFYCACTLDDDLQLSDKEDFQRFALSMKNSGAENEQIQEGLELVERICIKMEQLEPREKQAPSRLEAPYIPKDELQQNATSNNVSVKVEGYSSGTDVYYSLDGTAPSLPITDGRIKLNPGFNKTRTKEKDKTYTVQLKATRGGQSSETVSFVVTVIKNVHVWSGIEI